MRENCQWKDRCVFCETYGHCAVEVHDRNGHIFAFQIFSPHDKNIKIKGIMDNRYFEEIENPLQYYMNGKLTGVNLKTHIQKEPQNMQIMKKC